MRSKKQPWENIGQNYINYGIDTAKTKVSPFEKANWNLIQCHRSAIKLGMHYGDFMALKESNPGKVASMLAAADKKQKQKGKK